jgi:hypothetical protein
MVTYLRQILNECVCICISTCLLDKCPFYISRNILVVRAYKPILYIPVNCIVEEARLLLN